MFVPIWVIWVICIFAIGLLILGAIKIWALGYALELISYRIDQWEDKEADMVKAFRSLQDEVIESQEELLRRIH